MIMNFVEARQHLERTDRAVRDKVTSCRDAVQLIQPGDLIGVGGCLYSRTPMALLMELLRQGQDELSLSRSLTCYEGELLLANSQSTHIITSWMGFGAPWGASRVMRDMVEAGEACYEEWSHLAIGLRYRAGAMGVPFLPMLSMLGSDLMRHKSVHQIECPYTGQILCAVPALHVDVALVHVHRADPYGNAQIDGYLHMDLDIVRSAKTVILSAEEIVDSKDLVRGNSATVIPHFAVDAVVSAPFGSYPHECYGLYDADFAHFKSYSERSRGHGVEGVRSYIDEYVTGTASHWEFLNRFSLSTGLRSRSRAQGLVR